MCNRSSNAVERIPVSFDGQFAYLEHTNRVDPPTPRPRGRPRTSASPGPECRAKNSSNPNCFHNFQSKIATPNRRVRLYTNLPSLAPGDTRVVGSSASFGNNFNCVLFSLLVEGLDGLLPARLSRIVQRPQIAKMVRCRGPSGVRTVSHQRPIPVLLTVFAPMVVGAETYWADGVRRKLQFK